MKITEYVVARGESLSQLIAEVNHLITEYGWQPHGGILILSSQYDVCFIQAMVKSGCEHTFLPRIPEVKKDQEGNETAYFSPGQICIKCDYVLEPTT